MVFDIAYKKVSEADTTDTTMPTVPVVSKEPATPVGEAPQVRVVFMGTPDFSKDILAGLTDAGYHVVAVYTRPDKPVGRKQSIATSPVKRFALEHEIPVEQPSRFDHETIKTLKAYRPDLIIVAAYGRILPPDVLAIPGFGCLNVHASLLPRWRGASPVQNVFLSGDTETGVSIMLMDAGMDTGPVFVQEAFPIGPDDTRESLLSRMTADGIRLLKGVIPQWIEKRIEPKEQDGSKATLCELIEREDGRLFWNETAETLWNRYRGLHPWPGIFTFWKREDGLLRLKLVRISAQRTEPSVKHGYGEVFEVGEKIAIQTGEGLIFVEEIQPEGKGVMSIRDFLNGRPDFIGAILG
ncbi:MAG: methionyl-tRNA formyltransferase [Candidatus Moraniibacteriota bacterium]